MAAPKKAAEKTGFFAQYEPPRGGGFLSTAEKELLIDEQVAFPILSVSGPAENEYNGKVSMRYIVSTELDGETKLLGFEIGSVYTRDDLLAKTQKWLAENPDDPPTVVLVRKGSSQLLVDADSVA